MKKVFFSLVCAGILATVACGPSEADKKAAEQKRIEDSIRIADSTAAAMKAEADAAAASMANDSSATNADSTAAAAETK